MKTWEVHHQSGMRHPSTDTNEAFPELKEASYKGGILSKPGSARSYCVNRGGGEYYRIHSFGERGGIDADSGQNQLFWTSAVKLHEDKIITAICGYTKSCCVVLRKP